MNTKQKNTTADYDSFFHSIGKLKKVKRTGWVREGVPNAESVAEHIYRVSMMAYVLAPKGLKINKIIKMALVHELGEIVIGDLVVERSTVVDSKAKEIKEKRERAAVKELCESVERKDLYKLWLEYEKQSSPEAKFVKQMDKLEMAFQAHEYEHEHGKNLSEFFKNTELYLKEPSLVKLFKKLTETRRK